MNVQIPFLGDGIDSATVLSILVSEGDKVEKDQSIMELETDKAVAPVPSSGEGVIDKILVKEGEMVSTGTIVVQLKGTGTNGGKQASDPVPVVVQPSQPVSQPSSQVAVPVPSVSSDVVSSPTNVPEGIPIAASPSIRHMAREYGLDLSRIQGTGHGGRIQTQDVRQYLAYLQTLSAKPQATVAKENSQKPAQKALPDFSKWGPISERSVSSLRQKIAANMQASWSLIPHVTQFDEADITDVMALRKTYAPKYEKKGTRLTLTVFAMKAVVEALKAFPNFNASYDESNGTLIVKNYFHIGIAVDTDSGLIVPVIRDVDKKDMLTLSKELNDVAEKARKRTLSVEDLQGGTFTISNLGGLGVSSFTPIVNAPEVAILALARGVKRPVYQGDKLVPRVMLPLGVSYDHRVIDGADGARFVRAFIEQMEHFKKKDVTL